MTNQEAKEYLVKEGYAEDERMAEGIILDVKATFSYTQYISEAGTTNIGIDLYNSIKG